MLMYPRLCLQSTKWLRTYLTNQYVILRYCSPNLCKWNYFYGNLHFYKIQVNHFMTWDELPGAILSFKSYLPFINRLLGPYNIQLKTSRGILFLPPSDAYVRSFLYLLYTLDLLHKSSEQSSLISGSRLNSSPPEAKNPDVLSFSNNLPRPEGNGKTYLKWWKKKKKTYNPDYCAQQASHSNMKEK